MMVGNHRTLCTFTMQQIGRWVVTHSKADSNLEHWFRVGKNKSWKLSHSPTFPLRPVACQRPGVLTRAIAAHAGQERPLCLGTLCLSRSMPGFYTSLNAV